MIIVWKKFYNMLRRIQDPYDNDNICIVYASISRCYKGLHYRQDGRKALTILGSDSIVFLQQLC